MVCRELPFWFFEVKNMDKAIVTFYMVKKQKRVDIEVPLNISADELVKSLNAAYSLGIETGNPRNCYILSENPIALLKGNKTLEKFGIHNGSILRITE